MATVPLSQKRPSRPVLTSETTAAVTPTVNRKTARDPSPTPAPILLSRAAIARLTGVSKAAITKACRASLEPACVGSRVDVTHPAAVAYLDRRRVSSVDRKAAMADATDAVAVSVAVQHAPAELIGQLQRECLVLWARLRRACRALDRLEHEQRAASV